MIKNAANQLNVSNNVISQVDQEAQQVGNKLYSQYPPQPTIPISDQIQLIIDQTTNNLVLNKKQLEKEEEDIRDKMSLSERQREEIAYKKRLIETRNRMLQLTYEKNIYKKKIIYTLLALIVLLIIIMLCAYSFFRRGASNVSRNI